MNRGDYRLPEGRIPDPGGIRGGPDNIEQTFREGIRDLNQVRQQLGADDTAKNVGDLIKEMQRFDPSRFAGGSNQELLDRIRAQVIPNIEQLEIELRRKLDDKQSGQVRTGATDQVPTGFADAVAEYFRRLSKGK